jgi:hypothetical protein
MPVWKFSCCSEKFEILLRSISDTVLIVTGWDVKTDIYEISDYKIGLSCRRNIETTLSPIAVDRWETGDQSVISVLNTLSSVHSIIWLKNLPINHRWLCVTEVLWAETSRGRFGKGADLVSGRNVLFAFLQPRLKFWTTHIKYRQ